jgi:choline transport protein
MSASGLLNALLGLAAVLTLAFSLPAPLASLLAPGASPSASPAAPFIAAFAGATRSAPLTAAATALLVALLFGAALSAQAAARRHVVRLARDDAVPLAPLWAAAGPRGPGAAEAPPAALLLALGATVALALLHLGVDAAFETGVGVFVAATASAYFVGIACALLHRLRPRERREAARPSWSLGRLSVPAGAFALAYLALVLGFSFLPLSRSGLTPATMNWSAVAWVAAMLFASLVYGLHGRYVFKGPSGMFGLPFEDPASFRPESYLPTYGE